MQQHSVWIGASVLAVAVVGAVTLASVIAPSPSGVANNVEDSAIRAQVAALGAHLQNVSLLAPTAERKAAMDQNYGLYVAPELLTAWYPEGAEGALGRYSSSPWPDRIEIVEIMQKGNRATVEGNVIEVMHGQNAAKEAAAVQPVTLTLEKRDGRWLVVGASKGSYSQLPRRQTVVGYWECLPHKDTTGPHTMECAFGIAIDQSDGHYAVDTALMSAYPVDIPVGAKVRVSGIVTPVEQLSSIQKYDIDGILRATNIERI